MKKQTSTNLKRLAKKAWARGDKNRARQLLKIAWGRGVACLQCGTICEEGVEVCDECGVNMKAQMLHAKDQIDRGLSDPEVDEESWQLGYGLKPQDDQELNFDRV